MIEHGGRTPSGGEYAHLHRLYQAVRERNLALNTWELPGTLFRRMHEDPAWELLLLHPKDGGPAAGVLGAFRGPGFHAPVVIGLDYRFVRTQGLYRQFLRHMALRGKALGARKAHLGVGAAFVKTRFGARALPRNAWVLAEDHDSAAVHDQLWAEALGSRRSKSAGGSA